MHPFVPMGLATTARRDFWLSLEKDEIAPTTPLLFAETVVLHSPASEEMLTELRKFAPSFFLDNLWEEPMLVLI